MMNMKAGAASLTQHECERDGNWVRTTTHLCVSQRQDGKKRNQLSVQTVHSRFHRKKPSVSPGGHDRFCSLKMVLSHSEMIL